MMIKFLAHGTGKAGNAAAYVLASHDHNGDERPGVAVLRGDPQQFAAVADSLDFRHRYRSAVISWSNEEAPSADEISAVLDDFEALSFAGLDRQDVHLTAVQHLEEEGGAHVHILVPRVHLGTGKSLNIAPPGHRKDFDALRDKWNYAKGWARPDDPLRSRLNQPDFDAYKAQGDKSAIKQQVGDHLKVAVIQGLIQDRGDLVAYLGEVLGCAVHRQGKDYITIRPEGYLKSIRLKGELYGEGWRAENTLEREATAAARAGVGRGGHVDQSQSDEAQRAFDAACERRADYNERRYCQAERADHQIDRGAAAGLEATTRDRGGLEAVEPGRPRGYPWELVGGPEQGERRGHLGFDRPASPSDGTAPGARGSVEPADVSGLGQILADQPGNLPGRVGQRTGRHELAGARDPQPTAGLGQPERRDQSGRADPGTIAKGDHVRERQGQALHRGEADRQAVRGDQWECEGQDGRGSEIDDRVRGVAAQEAGRDGAEAPARDTGVTGAARRATALLGELAAAVTGRLERVRVTLQRLTGRVRTAGSELPARAGQPGAELGADAKGHERGAWVIEQQCGYSQRLAGELEQGASRVTEQAKEVLLGQERELDRGGLSL